MTTPLPFTLLGVLFFTERTKHIDLDCHFTREKVMLGLIELSYLPTRSQLADVLTKILPSAQFKDLLFKLGMVPKPSLSLMGGDEVRLLLEQADSL